MNAFYKFRFYELDQSLAVNEEDEFAFFIDPFFCAVPKNELHISKDMILVFANSLGNQNCFKAKCKINAIFHPELGQLIKIDTHGLDYCITLANGQEIILNAEEEPGKIVSGDEHVTEWVFLIDLTPSGM